MIRAWVEIDLGALRRNGAVMAARANALLPMIKADGYGVGAIAAARALESLAPWGFGVATVDEGRELREAGVSRPIVVFTPLLPDELGAAREQQLTPALDTVQQITAWSERGGGAWHLAIDTGMHRAGAPWDAVRALRGLLEAAPPAGAFTHFHSAELDDGTLAEQTRRFEAALSCLPVRPPLLHAENSAALARTTRSRWSLGRPGVFLYGVGSGPTALVQPEPVVRMRARITEVCAVPDGETVSYDATYRAQGVRRIATVPVGYADGYRRALSNRGEALVAGRRVRVAGLVTMDMTMIDVTGVDCDVGDVVTLIGRDGGNELTVEAVAGAADVSPYELLTGLRARLPRHYVNEP